MKLPTVVLLLCASLSGQPYLQSTGSPTFTSAFPVEHGFINLSNGNLHLEIPLASYRGRGMNYSAKLVYDSRIWKWQNYGSYNQWTPTNVANSQGGWRFVTSADTGSVATAYDIAGVTAGSTMVVALAITVGRQPITTSFIGPTPTGRSGASLLLVLAIPRGIVSLTGRSPMEAAMHQTVPATI